MIVPPVRIVIGDDHGGMLPLRKPLEAVQGLHEGSVLKVEMDRDGCHTGPRLDSAQ
jgi:hypothetical protein